jgi:thioredoxin 1
MNPDLLIRLLWMLGIIAAALAGYWLANRIILNRARSQRQGLESAPIGRPTLLYFTTPDCAPCKTVQRPAIQRLQDLMGETLQVVEVDATIQPELASQWGVLSVPTTFIIDSQGTPRHVNHGVAATEKLLKQFSEMDLSYKRNYLPHPDL